MSTERAEQKFIRLLSGVAWADGEVSAVEREKITRIAEEIGLSPAEFAEVRGDLDRPAGLEATLDLGREFFESLPPSRRAELFGHLESLIEADGAVDPEERKIIEALQQGDAAESPLVVSRLRKLFSRKKGGGSLAASAGPTRTLLDAIRPRSGSGRVDEDRRTQAVLFGSILRRVAFADGRVDPAELEQIRAMLAGAFSFDAATVEEILAAVESQAADAFDRQRLCASFNRYSTMEERIQLLGCLFAIAKADASIADEELRELRLIANYLWIDAREFHQIRVDRG